MVEQQSDWLGLGRDSRNRKKVGSDWLAIPDEIATMNQYSVRRDEHFVGRDSI